MFFQYSVSSSAVFYLGHKVKTSVFRRLFWEIQNSRNPTKKAILFQSQLPPAAFTNRVKTHTVHQNLPLSEVRLLSHCLAFHCHSSFVTMEINAPEIFSFIFIGNLASKQSFAQNHKDGLQREILRSKIQRVTMRVQTVVRRIMMDLIQMWGCSLRPICGRERALLPLTDVCWDRELLAAALTPKISALQTWSKVSSHGLGTCGGKLDIYLGKFWYFW